ncbi:MAG: TIGR04282 family arsenosugar biosynthesis glycosyltransferase [Myxococcota bacterium]
MNDLAVCVMAKAPVPGRVKTRLCPPLSKDEAAQLAGAFLLDVWHTARGMRNAIALLSYAGDKNDFPEPLSRAESFAQQGEDLGARIEHTARAGLVRARSVLVIGSDLPGLPPAYLQSAFSALNRAQCDAVLGPSRDGGFYLIGLRACPSGLLADLPWSQSSTCERTQERLRERGMSVAVAPQFDDVDTIDDLTDLRNGIVAGSLLAPASARALSRLTCI